MTEEWKPVFITPFKWIDPRTIPPRTQSLSPRSARGFRASDGRFEEDDNGPVWIEFDEYSLHLGYIDTVYWCPSTGEVATYSGRAFCLGETVIENAATYALDGYLHIHATVGRWIKARGKGIFIIDWPQAFDRLRDAPRISGDPEIEEIYHRHMKPARMPKFIVLQDKL